MEIDPRIDVEPDESCALCGEPLLDENNLVLVESGRMVPMKKDERFLTFVPDRNGRPDDCNHAVLSLFHAHCLLTRFDLKIDWNENKGWHCGWCERSLKKFDRAIYLRVGTIDEDTLVFVPNEREKSTGIMCADCAYEGFGEGDMEEGRALLEAVS